MAAARSCILVLLHKTPREASLYYYDYKPRAAEGNAAQGEAVHIGRFNGKCVNRLHGCMISGCLPIMNSKMTKMESHQSEIRSKLNETKTE